MNRYLQDILLRMRVTRTTISDLRTKKRSLEKASFETVSRLYHFARTHEDELNKR